MGAHPSLARELLRHADWTRRLARSLLGDAGQVEDAVQDTWVAALRCPPRVDRPLAPWLRSVLHNRVLNRLRGDRRRRVRETAASDSASAPSPEELMGRLQTQRLLVESVCALAEPYRQTVLLRYFEGLSSSEIAGQMDLPAATVRGRLRTALAELREALEQRCGGRHAPMIALERLACVEERASSDRTTPAQARTPRLRLGDPARLGLGLLIVAGAAVTVLIARGRTTSVPVDAALTPALARSELPTSIRMATTSSPAQPAVRTEKPPAIPTPPSPAPARPEPSPGQAVALADWTIAGTVRLLGPVPPSSSFDQPGDPFCARFPALKSEDIVVGRDGGVANAVVRIAGGWRGQAVPPGEPATFEQRGCRYVPRILVAQVGQLIVVKNADEVVHEVHARIGERTLLTRSQAFGAATVALQGERAGDILRFGCTSHAGMTAYAVVSESPVFAVTTDDGRFRLEGAPPGKYRLEVWHERLGTRHLDVTVPSPAMGAVRFELGEEATRPAVAAPGDCAIAVEGTSPVAHACLKGGLKEAKKTMKVMVASGKARGLRIECDSCHRDDTDWGLLSDARRRFDDLIARLLACPSLPCSLESSSGNRPGP